MKHTPEVLPLVSDIPPWLDKDYDSLKGLRSDKQLPHALLLAGSPGIGKHRLALSLANAILCTENGTACGKCHSCKLWAAGNHPDFWHLKPEEGKQVISIDQVRSLLEFAYKTPQIATMKIIVVWPADLMNRNAANALLECLGEPPASTQCGLSSANPGRVPATIRSRCQVVRISEPVKEQAQRWLQNEINDEALAAQYLQVSNGQPLVALENGALLLDMHQTIAAAMESAAQGSAGIVQLTKPLLSYDLKPSLDVYLRLVSAIVAKLLGVNRSEGRHAVWFSAIDPAWNASRLLEHAQFVQNILKKLHAGSHLNDQLALEDLFLRLALCTQQD
ncbi:MAG: DNA polymerase III subunit delta' [Pseudomonadales bacterium]